MFRNLPRISKKSGLVMALLMALCLVVAQLNAASMVCRSDPIIFLSDGVHLQVGVSVGTSADDVISVQYQVHVPANVTINRVVYAPQWAKNKESVMLIADQPADSYQVVTVVRTGTSNVPVNITARKFGNGDGLTRKDAAGISGQFIAISF